MYIYICMNECMYVCTYVCMYVCAYVYVYLFTLLYITVYAHIVHVHTSCNPCLLYFALTSLEFGTYRQLNVIYSMSHSRFHWSDLKQNHEAMTMTKERRYFAEYPAKTGSLMAQISTGYVTEKA